MLPITRATLLAALLTAHGASSAPPLRQPQQCTAVAVDAMHKVTSPTWPATIRPASPQICTPCQAAWLCYSTLNL